MYTLHLHVFSFQGAIHCMAFSSDGRYLASAGNEWDHTILSPLSACGQFIELSQFRPGYF